VTADFQMRPSADKNDDEGVTIDIYDGKAFMMYPIEPGSYASASGKIGFSWKNNEGEDASIIGEFEGSCYFEAEGNGDNEAKIADVSVSFTADNALTTPFFELEKLSIETGFWSVIDDGNVSFPQNESSPSISSLGQDANIRSAEAIASSLGRLHKTAAVLGSWDASSALMFVSDKIDLTLFERAKEIAQRAQEVWEDCTADIGVTVSGKLKVSLPDAGGIFVAQVSGEKRCPTTSSVAYTIEGVLKDAQVTIGRAIVTLTEVNVTLKATGSKNSTLGQRCLWTGKCLQRPNLARRAACPNLLKTAHLKQL
jgi:hypothetical protein